MPRLHAAFAVAATFLAVGTIPRSADAFPPTPPPVIRSITPSEVDVLLGGLVSIQGQHFQTLSYLDVGGTAFYPWQLATFSDTLLQFSIPLASALGPTQVQVWTNGGLAIGSFSFVPNDPPILIGPTLVQNGTTHKWWTAGTPGRTGFLLVNLSGATVPLVGQSVLAYDLLLPVPQVSPIGVEELIVPVSGLPVGVTFWMQFATLSPPTNDIATLRASNLLPVTVSS